MTPEVNMRYKPIEGEIVGVVKLVEDGYVTWSANDNRILEMIPYQRFCEFFERVADEAVAP